MVLFLYNNLSNILWLFFMQHRNKKKNKKHRNIELAAERFAEILIAQIESNKNKGKYKYNYAKQK